MTTTANPLAIGVGFDTSRYGHHVTFLRPDLQPACRAFEFPESRVGYERVRQQLQQLYDRAGQVHFHIRLDAAGQYAANLEAFLRDLPFPRTLTVGEPARNAHYRKAVSPKRKADPVESHCAARFALLEQPPAAAACPAPFVALRALGQRLHAQVRHATRLTNQLHNLLARVFPELALVVPDVQAGFVLELLKRYPTPAQLVRARLASLTAIPHLAEDMARRLQTLAAATVGSFQGDVAAALVRQLVEQLRVSAAAEKQLLTRLTDAYRQLPQTNYLDTIPGIGVATAAVLSAKIVAIERFATAAHLVSYFGIFPEENTSGVGKDGLAKRGRGLTMSRKGNDLVRAYLWNAARTAILHNPAVRPLYGRLRARGCRGDVALGHCMRKLLHLVFAVWRSGKPFDPQHYPWDAAAAAPASTNEKTAGHTPDVGPARSVVTAVESNVPLPNPDSQSKDPPPGQPGPAAVGGRIDFAALRDQVSMEHVLAHLDCLARLKGSGPQRRGPCPIHAAHDPRNRSFSVHLGKKVFQCFHPPCAAHGNVLDLWAAVRRLPLHQAAQDLALTLHIPLPERIREEEPVQGTRN
jgi:transposase